MSQLTRFGRCVPLPSSVGILHELLVTQRDETARLNGEKDASPKADPDIESTGNRVVMAVR